MKPGNPGRYIRETALLTMTSLLLLGCPDPGTEYNPHENRPRFISPPPGPKSDDVESRIFQRKYPDFGYATDLPKNV